jgi:hypothetical protein
MDIIFDRGKTASFGRPDEPQNSAEKLVERRETMLHDLGSFMKADSVEYTDEGKSERYVLTKGKHKLVLSVRGNQYDGGWMDVKVEGEPTTRYAILRGER